jgi:hypothetical protein
VPTSSYGTPLDAQAVLDRLNWLRGLESVPPLMWSRAVADLAAAWAVSAPGFRHGGSPLAQAICMSSPTGTSGVIDCLQRMYDVEAPLAHARGADLFGSCDSGAGRCNQFNIGDDAFGHFCILMSACTQWFGAAAITPGWSQGQFNVFQVS